MSPIEIVWILIVLLFGIIGIVRTYPKELGVTTMCAAALLLVIQFGDEMLAFLQDSLAGSADWLLSDRFSAGFYIGTFLLIVYISYQGITLAFKGTPPKGPVSPILGLIVGLLNGYFIAGSVWSYLHRFDYPFGLVKAEGMSEAARRLVQYLPPHVFEPKPAYLLGLLLLLLILSVWK